MKRDPSTDDQRALAIAAVPDAFSKHMRKRLFKRGYTRMVSDSTESAEKQRSQLLTHVEKWGVNAWKPSYYQTRDNHPLAEDPGVAAVSATLAALCINDHSELEENSPSRIRPIANLCEMYIHTISELIYQWENPDLLQELAEDLYDKGADDGVPHPGRTCTDVTTVDAFDDDRQYIEIPMAAASDICLARATEDGWGGKYEASDQAAEGVITARIHDNHLYLPPGHGEYLWEDSLRSDGFGTLFTTMQQHLGSQREQGFANEAKAISDRIERSVRNGQYGSLYIDFDSQSRTVKFIRKAIEAQDVDPEQGLTTGEIYTAIQNYSADDSWDTKRQTRFSTPGLTESILEDLAEAGKLNCEERPTGELAYQIPTRSSNLDVETIEDLFELPCFRNMAERLKEKGPVRKDLYNFAALVMWLPQYHGASLDVIVEDLKDVFERWPWYDEEETDYQIRYEHGRADEDGDPYFPKKCDHEDMQRYCIGEDNCPYSIYGSIPFPQEMYDKLDSESSLSFQ